MWVCYSTLASGHHIDVGNIERGIEVRIEMETTIVALDKTRMSGCIETSTFRADFGSVHWRYFLDRDALSFCFVCDKVLQLEETPVMQPSVNFLSSILFSHAFQIFHHDSISCLELGDYLLADVVVNPSHELLFSARDFSEQSLCRQSAFSLEFFTQMEELVFDDFDLRQSEELSCGSDCNLIDSQINSDDFSIGFGILDFFFEAEQEEASSFLINPEQAFSDIPREILFEAIGNIELEIVPFFEQSQGKNILFETCNSREVISDRAVLDCGFGLGFLDDSYCLFDAGYCKLGWKSLPDFAIDERMKFDIIPYFILPRNIDAELRTFFIFRDSPDNLGHGFQPDFYSYSAEHFAENRATLFKTLRGEGAIPLTAKAVSILAPIL